jgi:hypothetical protein
MTRVLIKSTSITGMPNLKHVNNSILLAEQRAQKSLATRGGRYRAKTASSRPHPCGPQLGNDSIRILCRRTNPGATLAAFGFDVWPEVETPYDAGQTPSRLQRRHIEADHIHLALFAHLRHLAEVDAEERKKQVVLR